jgi:HSP20 family molecular chaperone IbpA
LRRYKWQAGLAQKAYDISLDLPGVKPEDLTVEVKDGQLSISGHRKEEAHYEWKTYHRVESQYGEFQGTTSFILASSAVRSLGQSS